jgi:hypothetical protein
MHAWGWSHCYISCVCLRIDLKIVRLVLVSVSLCTARIDQTPQPLPDPLSCHQQFQIQIFMHLDLYTLHPSLLLTFQKNQEKGPYILQLNKPHQICWMKRLLHSLHQLRDLIMIRLVRSYKKNVNEKALPTNSQHFAGAAAGSCSQIVFMILIS